MLVVAVQDYKPSARDWLSSYWKGFMSPDQMARIRNTGVPMNFLKEVRRRAGGPRGTESTGAARRVQADIIREMTASGQGMGWVMKVRVALDHR